MLSQWHSTMSQADAKWFADFMTEKSDGKPAESLSMMDFLRVCQSLHYEFAAI